MDFIYPPLFVAIPWKFLFYQIFKYGQSQSVACHKNFKEIITIIMCVSLCGSYNENNVMIYIFRSVLIIKAKKLPEGANRTVVQTKATRFSVQVYKNTAGLAKLSCMDHLQVIWCSHGVTAQLI